MKLRYTFAVITAMTAMSSGASQAASLDFNITADTSGLASIAFDGSTSVIGANISVDSLVGLGTTINDGTTLDCIDCTLSFTSGDFVSYTVETGVNGDYSVWNFAAGGSINITGTLAGTSIPAGSTLMSGSFTQVSVIGLPNGTFEFQIAAGEFSDTKNAELLSYYGLPVDHSYLGNINLSFLGIDADGNPSTADFQSTQVLSGDVFNRPDPNSISAVPVPAAAWLFGSGLLGFVAVGRRRRSV